MRSYEPFFDSMHHFIFSACMRVSPITFYGALGRIVGSLVPNHAFSKVTFTPRT